MNPATQPFKIEIADSPSGARILKPRGPLTLQNLFEFQDVSRQETTKPVILDLSAIDYMDSAGLGSVISIYTTCQRSKRGFAIVGLTERVRSLFEMTQVDTLLPTYATLAEGEVAVTPKVRVKLPCGPPSSPRSGH